MNSIKKKGYFTYKKESSWWLKVHMIQEEKNICTPCYDKASKNKELHKLKLKNKWKLQIQILIKLISSFEYNQTYAEKM